MSGLDKDTVETLKRSKEISVEFHPVIIDEETGEIISGRHRKQAGWTSIEKFPKEKKEEIAKKLNIPVEVVPLILRIHANVQRNISKEERKQEVNQLAEFLLKSGIPKGSLVKRLQELLPFSKRYILQLLPDEYKLEEQQKREPVEEQKPKEEVKAEEPKKEEQKPQEVKKPIEEPKPSSLDEALNIRPPLNLPSENEKLENMIRYYDELLGALEDISCPVCGSRETAGWLCHNINFKEVRTLLEEKIKETEASQVIVKPEIPPKASEFQKYIVRVSYKGQELNITVGEFIEGDDYIVFLDETYELGGRIYGLKVDQALLKSFFIDKIIKSMSLKNSNISCDVETDYEGTVVKKITVKGFSKLDDNDKNSVKNSLRWVIRQSIEKQVSSLKSGFR